MTRALLLCLLLGCRASSSSEDPRPTCTGPACAPTGVLRDNCAPGFSFADDACEPTLPPAACGPGTMAILGNAECQAVGVTSCASGFMSDGAGGCTAVLPATKCPVGKMAVPGETTCAPVASCGTGTWGDIPVDASTVYVDASFSGASDGSKTAPFRTIQEGVNGAIGIVAVAAGTYAENVRITKPVRVIGVCPDLVDLRAASGTGVSVESGANGGSVRGISVIAAIGIKITAVGYTLDRIRIHGTGEIGLVVVGPKGTLVTATGLLIEGATGAGIGLGTASLMLTRSVVRDTQAMSDKTNGRGIQVQGRGVLTVRDSLLERNKESGIFVYGSDATIERTVVRDTLPMDSDKTFGRGISAVIDGKIRSTLTVKSSVLERNRSAGISLSGADATVSDTVIRETFSQVSDGVSGTGITADADTRTKAASTLKVTTSLVAKNRDAGILAFGSELTVDRTIVRDTEARLSDQRFGTGIHVDLGNQGGARPTAKIASTLIAHNRHAGVNIVGADATIDSCWISDTQPDEEKMRLGRGINVQDSTATGVRSLLTLKNSMVVGSYESGIAVFGSDATIDGSVVRDTLPRLFDAQLGHGIGAANNPTTNARAILSIKSSLIERAQTSGLLAYGADVTIEGTVVRDILAQVSDGLYGDGIAAMTFGGAPANVTVTSCAVQRTSRASIAAFGATLSLTNSKLSCGLVDLDLEPIDGQPPTVTDGGKNLCGCGAAFSPCKGSTSNLAPAPPPTLDGK